MSTSIPQSFEIRNVGARGGPAGDAPHRKSVSRHRRRASRGALLKLGIDCYGFTSANIFPKYDGGFSEGANISHAVSEHQTGSENCSGAVYSLKNTSRNGRQTSRASSIYPKDGQLLYGCGYDSSEFDTSLEDSDDDERPPDCKDIYLKACRQYDVIPAKAFIRQIADRMADISYCMLGSSDVKALCVALTRNYVIQSLDLSGNDLRPKGAEYLTQSLTKNIYISCLYLASTKLGTEGILLLMTFLKENSTITTLDISENSIPGKHAVVIGETLSVNRHLREVRLCYCDISEDGISSIGDALATNSTLKVLDLSWNHLRTHGAVSICDAIGVNDGLEVLNLSWNGLGSLGCEVLVGALEVNRSLRELDLSCNRIDVHGLELVMQGVSRNETLTCLKLGQNPTTTDSAIEVLKAIHANPTCKISYLDIRGIPVGTDFIHLLEEIQADRDIIVEHSKTFHRVGNIVKSPSLQD